MKPSLRPVLLLAGGGILLSIISFVIWFSANNPHDRMVFGKIAQVTQTELVLENRDKSTRVFTLGESTQVFKGKEPVALSALKLGDFVQVSVERTETTSEIVSLVRIMRAPEKDSPHEKR